ncbi:MAG: twin-arginine translocase subunit TatC [Acidobacteria bacterium]|nr:twin-arginine translocase subunit TatC [Acidobacteriota bacterium]
MDNEPKEHEGLQMSFLDHLDELRQRLIYSISGIAIALGLCFAFSGYIFNFLAVPVKEQYRKAQIARAATKGKIDLNQVKEGEINQYTFTEDSMLNGVKIPAGTTVLTKKIIKDNEPVLILAYPWIAGAKQIAAETPVEQILSEGRSQLIYDEESNQLVVRKVTSGFTIYMYVSLYAGIVLAFPFLFYQVWAFISPGLYKHEKRYIMPVIAMGTILFVMGAAFAYKIAFPTACDFLLGWAQEGGFRTLLDAEDYLDLIMIIMVALGIAFQIPTISFVLGRIGLLTPKMMWKSWRYAVIIIAILSAVLTPTPDATTMLIFAGPMVALYFISIGIVWFFGKPRRSEKEITELAHSD